MNELTFTQLGDLLNFWEVQKRKGSPKADAKIKEVMSRMEKANQSWMFNGK